MRDDKIIIISHYYFLYTILFLCKSESENFISFWAKHDSFCLISLKKNLILFHFTEKKSDSVSSHQKKIWFCLISQKKNLIPSWFWPRTGLDQDGKSWFLQSAYIYLSVEQALWGSWSRILTSIDQSNFL